MPLNMGSVYYKFKHTNFSKSGFWWAYSFSIFIFLFFPPSTGPLWIVFNVLGSFFFFFVRAGMHIPAVKSCMWLLLVVLCWVSIQPVCCSVWGKNAITVPVQHVTAACSPDKADTGVAWNLAESVFFFFPPTWVLFSRVAPWLHALRHTVLECHSKVIELIWTRWAQDYLTDLWPGGFTCCPGPRHFQVLSSPSCKVSDCWQRIISV